MSFFISCLVNLNFKITVTMSQNHKGFFFVKIAPTLLMLYGDFPALLVEEDIRDPLCIISGTDGHSNRTTDIP